MTLPNFIGIGAPKSGTTWLAKCLGEHPAIFMPAAKELVVLDYGEWEDHLDDYRAHFESVRGQTAIGEFTTRYLASPRPAPRIKALIPDARLIICLRNPADQIYSHYWHLARQNFHQAEIQDPVSFEAALARYPELLKAPARYWDHLQFWLKFFPRDQFLVILYDDIKANPRDVLAQAFRFLEVDPEFTPTSIDARGTDVRKGASARNSFSKAVYDRLYTSVCRHIYHPLKRVIGVRRATYVKDMLRVRQIMESMFFRKGYPEMLSQTRDVLNREFAPHRSGIEELLGRKLDAWK